MPQVLVNSDIRVDETELPLLEEGEFYWYQLHGLRVISQQANHVFDLGVVKEVRETGSNDVLIIKSDDSSMDERERWIPYIPDQFIKSVDLNENQIVVDWDPEF